jgi:hypothetical protein
MPSPARTPSLYVEGKDDLATIAALLLRHGVDISEANRPLQMHVAGDLTSGAEGVKWLLANMPDAIRSADDHPVGFVLDIDVRLEDRWSAVCGRLREAGLAPPSVCPDDGYIDRLPNYPYPAGVWLMPDCARHHGKLEHLLQTLVPENDLFWPHAGQSTARASELGARFRDPIKAHVHCWLAWQEEPGRPFGTAIKAKFLGHDSPEALAFLRWLSGLFQIAIPGLSAS